MKKQVSKTRVEGSTEADEEIIVPPLGHKNINTLLVIVMTFFGMVTGSICLIIHKKKKFI